MKSPSESFAQWSESTRLLPQAVSRRVVAVVVVLLLAAVYVTATHFHIERVNTEILKADQGSYVYYARQMNETRYAYVGGRNQMPVMPFLVSLVDLYGTTTETLFERGKRLNVGISLCVLVGIAWLVRRSVPAFETAVMTAIVAFSLYVYRAGYVQAELLFYGLFFLAFLLALWWMNEPRPLRAVACGIVLGIAYLTKASVLPLLFATNLARVLRRLKENGVWLAKMLRS